MSDSPSPKLFALLIAIDEYHPYKVGALSGCVNDSMAVQAYLKKAVSDEKLHILPLYNEQATKENIVTAFQDFLQQARSEDSIFIHYSGHGSQEKAHPKLWHLDPDHLNETIVCYDRHQDLDRGLPVTQLADKELSWLLHKLYEKTQAHMVVVMDCCHSGSGTRGEVDSEYVKVRSAVGDTQQAKALENYVFYGVDDELTSMIDRGGEINIPIAPHVALSGCRSFELAKEQQFPEGRFGVFTYFLLKTLYRTKGKISYQDLIQQLGMHAANTVSHQLPQGWAPDAKLLKSHFLGKEIIQQDSYYQVMYSTKHNNWRLLAGSVHGIGQPASGEYARIAVYESLDKLKNRVAEEALVARVTKVEPHQSELIWENNEEPDQSAIFYATLLENPVTKTAIFFENELEDGNREGTVEAAAEELLRYLETNEEAKLYLQITEDFSAAKYRVFSYDKGGKIYYRITRPDNTSALLEPVQALGPKAAEQLVKQLVHMARWNATLALNNPDTQILPGDIQLEVLDEHDQVIPMESNELRLEYTFDKNSNSWKRPGLKLRVRNPSGKKLFAALLFLDANYEISAGFMPGEWFGPREVIAPGDQVLSRVDVNEFVIGQSDKYKNGQIIRMKVPDEFLAKGITETKDFFKLIVSTEEFDANQLGQHALGLAKTHRGGAAEIKRGPKSGLNKLFRALNTRSAGFAEEEEEAQAIFSDWTTMQVGVRTIRPAAADALPKGGIELTFPAEVNGEPHLSSSHYRPASRGAGGRTGQAYLPPFLLNVKDSQSIDLSGHSTRMAGATLDILEINNISNAEKVSEAHPLYAKLPVVLQEDEMVLAIASDGELWYPVGLSAPSENEKTAVRITSLPLEEGEQTRGFLSGLMNTAKLIFQRLKVEKIPVLEGNPPPYVRLVSHNAGKWTIEGNELAIRNKLEQAKDIVLVLHGFIGDSRSMLGGKEDPKLYHLLQAHYDAILAVDFDSYNTTLEDSAAGIQQRLAKIGLSQNHSKNLDILGHDIGGLVARWLLEEVEDGPKTRRLLLTGVPNGGSILPSLKYYLNLAGSLAMNGLNVVGLAFPQLLAIFKGAQLLMQNIDKFTGKKLSASLEEAAEDKVSDSLKKDSSFLADLFKNDAGGVEYIILSGVTGLIDHPETENKLGKLIQKLGINTLGYKVMDALLSGKNDLFVSQRSMTHLKPSEPSAQLIEVACDHFNYFSSVEGLKALEEVISKP